jgi:hypothetical protein
VFCDDRRLELASSRRRDKLPIPMQWRQSTAVPQTTL